MNLFPDIETTGLPRKEYNWQIHYELFPRIVSIAWRFNGVEKYYILNQKGRKIPPAATDIHGITDEMCAMSEHYTQVILKEFIEDTLNAERIIGHNIYFDSSIIKANVLREFGSDSLEAELIIKGLDKYKRLDIMRKSASFNKGWSTLSILHEKLFGVKHRAHNAAADAKAVEDCFNKLVELNVIQL